MSSRKHQPRQINAPQIWASILPEALKLGDAAPNWLKELTPIDILDNEFHLAAPSDLSKDWVINRYADDLLRLVRLHDPDVKRIVMTRSATALIPAPAPATNYKRNISFVHAAFCQVFFPRKQLDIRSHQRKTGNATLLIDAGKVFHRGSFVELPLPYGGKARTLMTEIQTQVAKTGSTTIEFDRSMRAFAENHGIDTNGRNLKMLANQAVYLGNATILLGYHDAATDRDVTRGGKVADDIAIWSSGDDQPTLWPDSIELNVRFRDAILEHHVPVDNQAMYAMDDNTLAQDFYVFFAYRLHALAYGKPTRVPWALLYQQFEGIQYDGKGMEIRPETTDSFYNWKKRAIKAITRVRQHYPDAKVEVTRDHLILWNSRPPILKTVAARLLRA